MRHTFISLVIVFAPTLSPFAGGEASDRSTVPAQEPLAVVFVADGAGNFQAASKALREVVDTEGLAIQVETFVWSHGTMRIVADQLDTKHSQDEGRRLAAEMTAFHARNPQTSIFLLGHSAGAGVALIGAENVPPGTLDGLILLSPSVSTTYDLRPALRNCRLGIDVFYSKRDWFYLALATRVFGTADRRRSATSGRVGFKVQCKCPEDTRLFSKLRQRPWREDDCLLGNRGGHYGNYQPEFLRTYVVPVLYNSQIQNLVNHK